MKLKIMPYMLLIPVIFIAYLFLGCSMSKNLDSKSPNLGKGVDNGIIAEEVKIKEDKGETPNFSDDNKSNNKSQIDYDTIRPNELGEVMVLMYHNFGETEKDSWWRSFDNFKKDLNLLYQKGYMPISLDDFIFNNINIPAGKTPVVFTFDDATLGQFSLIEKEGNLAVNPQSAVGIMIEFNKVHPDFGLEGTFYINEEAFAGSRGTEKERLQYLLDLGFDIGNHTFGHVNLGKADTYTIQKSIGQHVDKMEKYFPEYKHRTLALPYGAYSNSTFDFVEKGQYGGMSYKNEAILLVGWKPSPPIGHRDLNVNKLLRVRASEGIPNDMYYYLEYFDKNIDKKYISDGDKDAVSLPSINKELIDNEKLKNKRIIIY